MFYKASSTIILATPYSQGRHFPNPKDSKQYIYPQFETAIELILNFKKSP